MKKIVLVFIFLVAVLGGLTYWFFENLDDFIKSYMVEYGSKMTKTDVEVDSVKTDISKGEIFDYFNQASSDDIIEAYHEFDGLYSEEELRLVRIRYMSEIAN